MKRSAVSFGRVSVSGPIGISVPSARWIVPVTETVRRRTSRTGVDSARCALVLPLLFVLWRMGPRYRPWAAFATVVVALLLGSGLMQSFGRQSLYAFPIFWAVGEGPAWLRRPPLLALGFAANLAIALLLTRFAP